MKTPYQELSPRELLKKVTEQGFLIDLYGGHNNKALSFAILNKLNNNHYTIDSNLKKTISCFCPQKFADTLHKIEKQTKIDIFK